MPLLIAGARRLPVRSAMGGAVGPQNYGTAPEPAPGQVERLHLPLQSAYQIGVRHKVMSPRLPEVICVVFLDQLDAQPNWQDVMFALYAPPSVVIRGLITA